MTNGWLLTFFSTEGRTRPFCNDSLLASINVNKVNDPSLKVVGSSHARNNIYCSLYKGQKVSEENWSVFIFFQNEQKISAVAYK